VEGLTQERKRKSDIGEKSCKWEGTSKNGRTITQFGCKFKYEEKERKKERKQTCKENMEGK
jgi:hypothetical protein